MSYRSWSIAFLLVAALPILIRPALAAAQTSGLVAAYGFNAGAGTIVTDASGNDNTGTIQGANWTSQGKFGGALEFNGTNGYVSVANSPSLDISGSELTLSMWINPQPLSGGDSVVLGKFWNATMTSPLYQYGLELASGREPFFYLGTSGGVRSARMGSKLTLNQWSHLAVVFGGSQVRFYVNGTLVRTRPLSASIQARGTPLRIGADIVPAQFHKGFLDEVRIYNRALTQTAIQSDMNTAVGGGTPNTAPTITSIPAKTINEDTATGALGFTVGDAETAAGSLTVTGTSSNPTLVPGGTIVFGGSGAARTVTVTPAAGQSGMATITVSVSDGQLSTSTSFQLTVTAVNDAPTITSIPNQTTSVGTAVGPLGFTVGDAETAAGSLTVSGSSSNPTLMPGGTIVFGGSGAARTVTVTPAAGQSGTATITVSVSDGQLSTSTSFQLTVTAVNNAPTITSIPNRTINEDTATGALGFTVGDAETAAGSLTVTGTSSNPTLVPGGTIAFGGSGAARTVTVTPAAGQSGTATITVSVSDGQLSTSTSFQLTVTAVNDAPTITSIPNQTTSVGTAVGPLGFTVGDAETAAGSLTVSGSSSNPTLMPGGNIAFGGSGAARTVTVTPAAGQSGTATITVSVSDGQASTSTAFQLTVTATSVGLAAGWNFNEGSGSFANDISGHNNTAIIQGVALWSAGEYGGGITLSGSSFLAVSTSPSLDISGSELTLSMWIKPQPLSGGDSVVIGKFWNTTMTSPFYQYGLELDAGSTPHFYVGTTGGLVGAAMGNPLPFGQWSHLGVAFDGSEVLFYLNGALLSTRPLAADITARGNPMNIGADANAAQLFNGTLDDVRVYGRVLTQAEIQADMNTPLGGVVGPDPNPPTVAISSPANNAQVSDIVVLAADAADNIGVAGVQFLVDGVLVGAEDSQPPYGLSWDTRTVTNGAHIVTARARDTSGNVTVSAPVTVNVTNTNFFVNEILATGFDLPTSIEFLPDGRMLVVELQGIIKVLPPPYLQPDPTPFLQLANIGSFGVQQGIYDIALDPDFVNNRFYYVFYTAGDPNRDRLSRFTANASLTGTVAGSELVLYQDPQNPSSEHHGGAITFGNDGRIYFTTGEHFNAGDAQLLSNPRGKIHRINKNGTVPTDNPFYDGPGPNWDSIWALGLRNPFRAYYDAPTGRLFVGDVGGNDYAVAKEEVNLGVAGANYGWPNFEGPCPAPCRSPIYFYPHNGRDASVTGGFVYRGTQFPSAYHGSYFFADYTQNWIRRLTFDANGNVNGVFNFEPTDGSVDGPYGDIVYLTEGPDGALYYVDLGYSDIGGSFGISKIRRIRYVQNNQAPVAVAAATPTKGPRPLTVSFSSNGSADPEGQPLAYAWTFGDGSTSTEASPTHTYTQNGNYTVRLSVSDGVTATLAPPLVINVGTPPTVTILSPPDGIFFRAGDVIAFSGDATDLEDGPLSAGTFSWSIDFLHEGHVHPGVPVTGTKSGSFTIPVTGHDFSGNTRYRITLTATDSDGLQSSRAVIAYPEKVNLSFGTVPDGLTLGLDGIARTAPFVHDTLIGFNHTIEAPDQIQGYLFESWSDGGPQQHTIVVPPTPQSLTATFTESPLPPGVVAAWTFSEGAGRSANDATGNGNTATFVNGTAWAAGPHDNSVSFNGVDGYLSVANSPSLNISGSELTLSMWINPQPLSGGDSVVLGKFWNATMISPFYQYGLELAGGQEPVFYLGTNAGVLFARMGSILSVGQWSHLAVVFNGSQARFYVNGTLVGTAALSGSIQARGNPLHIGADITPAQFYRGFLDEVRIYNRALTASEIQRDMTTALAGP